MVDHAKNLRSTRADMIGTDGEEHYWECHAAATRIDLLESALKEISKGVGAYSQDQLTNAGNTIDSIVKIADKAIADCKESK